MFRYFVHSHQSFLHQNVFKKGCNCNPRHVWRSVARMDHSRALRAVISGLLEESSRPTQTVMDANHWERSECTRHRSAHGVETSSGLWTIAMNSGSGCAPSWGLPLMMMMMMINPRLRRDRDRVSTRRLKTERFKTEFETFSRNYVQTQQV